LSFANLISSLIGFQGSKKLLKDLSPQNKEKYIFRRRALHHLSTLLSRMVAVGANINNNSIMGILLLRLPRTPELMTSPSFLPSHSAANVHAKWGSFFAGIVVHHTAASSMQQTDIWSADQNALHFAEPQFQCILRQVNDDLMK
jgi:hypothetical protein